MGYKEYFIYMMTNRWHTALYTGMTNSLQSRTFQHKTHSIPGFTKKYNCDRLVYFELYNEVDQAIAREKQIKGWSRAKKDALIATLNPNWDDLASDWYDTSEGVPRRLRGSE